MPASPDTPTSAPAPSDAAASRTARRIRMGLVALVLACAFGFAGTRAIWEPDEGRYVAVALEMLRTGDWLHPALNDEHPHYTKPPLTYWALAASLGVLGRHEWAARLPNALAFAATIACAAGIGRRLAPGRGAAAAAILATSALPFVAANIVTTDTLLACAEAAAMLGFVRAWRRLDDPAAPGLRPGGVRLMWLAFGAAFLVKGPPGLLPLLAVVPAVVRFDGLRALRGLLDPLGLLGAVALGGSWYAAVVLQDPSLARYFLGNEVYGRIVGGVHGRNSEWWNALMYPPLLIGGMLPWSVGWLARRARGGFAGLGGDPARWLLLAWVVGPCVVFMLSSSRMPLYVVPLAVPLAVASARLQPERWLAAPATWRFLAGTAVVLLAQRALLGSLVGGRDARALARGFALSAPVEAVVFVDTREWWGVALYAGAPVKQATLREEDVELGVRLLPDSLAHARDERIALVLRDGSREAVHAALAAAGRAVEAERRADDRIVIEVAPARRTVADD